MKMLTGLKEVLTLYLLASGSLRLLSTALDRDRRKLYVYICVDCDVPNLGVIEFPKTAFTDSGVLAGTPNTGVPGVRAPLLSREDSEVELQLRVGPAGVTHSPNPQSLSEPSLSDNEMYPLSFSDLGVLVWFSLFAPLTFDPAFFFLIGLGVLNSMSS